MAAAELLRRLAVFATVYVAAALLGQWPTLAPGLTATLWPPSGLMLAVLLLTERRYWPHFALTAFAADFAVEIVVYDYAAIAAAVVALGNILEALVGASLVLWWCGSPFQFRGLRDVLALTVLSAMISTTISATVGAAVLYVTGAQAFAPAWLLWWLGDGIGILIVTPLVIAIIQASESNLVIAPARIAEAATLCIALLFACHLVFSGHLPFAFVILPFLIWAALRFGVRGAAFALAILAGMTFGYITAGFQPFASPAISAFERTVLVQAFLGIVSVSILLLAAVIEQLNITLEALHGLTDELEARVENQTAALRESDERARLALSAGRFGSWQLVLSNMSLTSSDQCKANFGLSPSDPFTFETFSAALHPEDREKVIGAVQRAIEDVGVYEADYRCVWPDGSIHWLNTRGRAAAGADGRATRMGGVTLDITERRAAEVALRESEERLRLFIEHAPAALAMFDREMRYVSVSRRWLSDYGLDGQDLRGRSHYDVFPEIPERWREIHRRALDGEVVRADEDRFVRANGHVQWLRWEVRPWHDASGRIAGIVVFSEDITERRQAEESLAENREQLALALAGAGAAEWSWDIVHNRLAWSGRYRTLHGFKQEEAGDYATWLERVHPDDRERLDRRVSVMLATPGDDTWQEEFRIVHPERGVLWLAGLGRIKRDANGAAVRMTGINIDVTQRRQAEFQLRLHQNAQSRLARLGALGELAAGIAHEINQPLMAARIYTQLTAEALASLATPSAEARDSAEKAVAQIERAANVMRRLREFIQFGRSALTPADVSEIVRASVTLMQPEIERAGVTVREDIQFGLPKVKADVLQIEQVILNILRNSVEAITDAKIPNGTVTIEGKLAQPGFVEIAVHDTGPGFPPEQPPGPPQPFMTTKAEGLGFGLSLSRSIIEAHGGRLWIGEGKSGASVHFTLAAAEGESS